MSGSVPYQRAYTEQTVKSGPLQASEDAVAPERERERAAQTAAAASGPTLERYEVFSSG